MTKDEALKLALEALETKGEHHPRVYQAITAIKQVLANDALEKKAENAKELGLDYEPNKNEFKPDWDEKLALTEEVIRLSKRIEELEAQPEQHQDWCASLTQMLMSMPPKPAPCNCKPPQRTWVGMTDEEELQLAGVMDKSRHWLVAAVEAKLKEKNT